MRNLKRALSLALASVMVLGMMVVGAGAASYPDVDSNDNLEAIEVLKLVGAMSGDNMGNFNPDALITRNEAAVVIARLLDMPTAGTCTFTDVPAWAQPYVAIVAGQGISSGIGNNQFGGSLNITAAQAALWLLRTLGYFEYQGEFEDDWAVSTVKRANLVGLFDGVKTGANSPLTRNQLAQMALNALEADVVVVKEIGGISVEGNGITVNEKPTYSYPTRDYDVSKDYRTTGTDSVMQLCEKLYGEKLKKQTTAGTQDAFGRPSTQWKYQNSTVTTPEAADLIYTKQAKAKTIYADLGLSSAIPAANVTVYTDGSSNTSAPSLAINNSNDTDKFGGNGSVTEVYYDATSNTAKIVVIHSYVGKVTDVKTNSEDSTKYDITLDAEGTKTFKSSVKYDIKDVVTYTKTIVSGSTDAIKSITPTTKMEGEVTWVKDADSFKVNGVTYSYGKKFSAAGGAKLDATAVDFEVAAYLDSYGYVVLFGSVSSNTNYAYVAAYNSSWTGVSNYEAKLAFADGTAKVVPVKDDPSTNYQQLVTYTVNSEGVYTLTNKAAINGTDVNSALKVENGKANVTVAGTAYTATNKTVFIVYNTTDKVYTAYTGIKNVADLDNGSASYQYAVDVVSGVLKAVYIESANDVLAGTTAETASLFYVTGSDTLIKDTKLGDYKVLKAVVDGKATEVKVDAALFAAGKPFATAGAVISTKVTTNSDGIITNVVVGTNGLDSDKDGYLIGSLAVVAAEDDVITIGGTGYTYADDVTVFQYDKSDKAFTAKTIESLQDGTYDLYVQVEGNVIQAIYYVVA